MRANKKIIERPQHMWMRVSLGIHGRKLLDAFETYNLMSTKHFTHATPTLFNSGASKPLPKVSAIIANLFRGFSCLFIKK